MSTNQSRLLVTGAGGHLGRRVAELLVQSGIPHVIAASRHPEKLADLVTQGVEARRADFDDPETLEAAFAGIDRALIVSTDALGIPGQRQRQHKAAVDAAVRAGVDRIVYTSMPNPEPGSVIPFAADHYQTERAIEDSGVPFTILRVNWYAENVLGWLPQALASGTWVTSAADGRVGYVAREDAARAAAAALSSGTAENRPLDITGPQALRTEEVAAIAREVSGRTLKLVRVTDDELAAGLRAAGLPAPVVELLVAMDANTRVGGVDVVSDAVERLTGKPPLSFRAFLIETRDTLTIHASDPSETR